MGLIFDVAARTLNCAVLVFESALMTSNSIVHFFRWQSPERGIGRAPAPGHSFQVGPELSAESYRILVPIYLLVRSSLRSRFS